MDNEKIAKNLVSRVKKFFIERGFKKAVLGLSGGIDSALTAKILVNALGKENVICILMHEKKVSSENSFKHAEDYAKELGVKYYIKEINPILEEFEKVNWAVNEYGTAGLKTRIRMSLLYSYANTHHALVVGTGNKSELMLGYFNKYGDGGVDLLLIGALYKTEVFELAKYLNLPTHFIEKKPSAELYKGQTDEEELGFSYFEIDKVLTEISNGKSKETLLKKFNNVLINRVFELVELNKHKLEKIPIIKSD